MAMQTYLRTSLNLKDAALWRQVKAQCALKKLAIVDLIEQLLREWLARG